MIDPPVSWPKASGSASERKEDSKLEQVRQSLKEQGKEIQRPKPGRMPLFRR